MRNEKELIAFGFDMSLRIDNNKDSTTTFSMSFDCLIEGFEPCCVEYRIEFNSNVTKENVLIFFTKYANRCIVG